MVNSWTQVFLAEVFLLFLNNAPIKYLPLSKTPTAQHDVCLKIEFHQVMVLIIDDHGGNIIA